MKPFKLNLVGPIQPAHPIVPVNPKPKRPRPIPKPRPKPSKRYSDLLRGEFQVMELTGPAKKGMKRERNEAMELHNLLRTHTYLMIGLGNVFRRIAGDFSGKDGSNWRNNRQMPTEKLRELATKLYSTNPYDVDSILKIENELELIVNKATKQRGAK